MSFTRRLAAGLPAVGVTLLAGLALTGGPAAATGDGAAARAGHPAVMTVPCSQAQRGDKCDYAHGGATSPTRGNGGYGSTAPSTSPSTSTPATTPATPSMSPSASPSPSTPTASVDTVPPGGESPAVSPSASPSQSTPGGGVSAGGTLPLTGAPMGLTVALGGLMIIGGGAAVYYSRRRRSA
jgi:LPXTG-motif cell wall-anchored protein